MKTTKFNLIVLFALSTTQLASAYYCPSDGRWLSRDPIGEPGFQALQTAAQTSIRPTPLPSSDRWIIRDPSPSSEESNEYAFVENKPISYFDKLGLACCCGVNRIEFYNRGWTASPTGFSFKFDIVIKFKKDKTHDPSCCRYIQWVQAKPSTQNGVQGPTQAAGDPGGPIDGHMHVDSWNYKGDNDTNPTGGIYQDQDSSDTGFKSTDTPGWGGFNNGDVIDYDTRFRGTVIDTCNGNKVVAKKDFKITASGTWPKLTYSP